MRVWLAVVVLILSVRNVDGQHYAPANQKVTQEKTSILNTHVSEDAHPADASVIEHRNHAVLFSEPPRGAHTAHGVSGWTDCIGVVNGTTAVDQCGTCGGNDEACRGCDKELNSGLVLDCNGLCGGSAVTDCRGVCGGNGRKDCFGRCGGNARVDQCDKCNGNNECLDCKNVPWGSSVPDECGECDGKNECWDCKDVPWGSSVLDECDVCDGNNECLDCEGVRDGDAVRDVCGDCNGDGKRCLGCDEVPYSGKVTDRCGVCDGDGSSCCGPKGACANHGVCDSYLPGCVCDLGYTGPNCTVLQNLCQFQDCGKHGTCNSKTGDCVCEEDYAGDYCEYPTCSGHGIYDRFSGGCKCLHGYTGSDCGTCSPHPHRHDGVPDTDVVYVCLLKERAFHTNRVNQAPMYDASLRFSLQQVKEPELVTVLGGTSSVTRKTNRKAILPGSELNGHIYGCDCQPATPDPRVYLQIDDASNEMDLIAYEGSLKDRLAFSGKAVSNGAVGKFYTKIRDPQHYVLLSNTTQIKNLSPSDRFFHFKDAMGQHYRDFMTRDTTTTRAPADLGELQTYANKVSDIFNLNIDATSDDSSVLLGTTSDIQEELNFNENFYLYFTAAMFVGLIIMMAVAMILICYLTQSGTIEKFREALGDKLK